ncbi:MAG: hypothetical protein IPN81_01515 [Nitrosomonadales bacterium]|nr:hypothetical protein [Nitrosomonadales bacterium]
MKMLIDAVANRRNVAHKEERHYRAFNWHLPGDNNGQQKPMPAKNYPPIDQPLISTGSIPRSLERRLVESQRIEKRS